MSLFTDAFTTYALDMDLRGSGTAQQLAEGWADQKYKELSSVILRLLPWAGNLRTAAAGFYNVINFNGRKTTRWEVSNRQLQHLRDLGTEARAWEALCAVMAAISSRGEKVWLECHDLLDELKTIFKKQSVPDSKLSSRRRDTIRKEAPKMVEDGAGFFALALIDPRSVHYVTFAKGPEGPLPATSMIIRRMPLWDALKTMDWEGPLRGAAADKGWLRSSDRQFALQDLQLDHEDKSRKERTDIKDLEPDNQLRDLLRSKRPVVLLDTLAALAPREVCKTNEFSRIVQAELVSLVKEAKAQGEAVVFHVASDDPCKLAKKVYMRSPVADYGMRCGCLRWRASPSDPWAREFHKSDERLTLCLQMP